MRAPLELGEGSCNLRSGRALLCQPTLQVLPSFTPCERWHFV